MGVLPGIVAVADFDACLQLNRLLLLFGVSRHTKVADSLGPPGWTMDLQRYGSCMA